MRRIITNLGVTRKTNISIDSNLSLQIAYEVIRVVGGIALFLEDHYHRLLKTMEIQGIPFGMEYQDFRHKIAELIKLNRMLEGNIKFEYSIGSKEPQWVFSFITHSYPTWVDYLNGVKTDLLFEERENPNAKVVQNRIREKANQMLAGQSLYEVLLVDRSGLITEGSRSNVFFVKDGMFYTAPSALVLVGITREKVIGCLSELSLPFTEEAIHADEIRRFDAVFLTGTSPKVLPVQSIGSIVFNTQLSVVKTLMDSYNRMIARYIQDETELSDITALNVNED